MNHKNFEDEINFRIQDDEWNQKISNEIFKTKKKKLIIKSSFILATIFIFGLVLVSQNSSFIEQTISLFFYDENILAPFDGFSELSYLLEN